MKTNIKPITYEDKNFYHDGNDVYIGEFVQDHMGRRGRVFDVYFTCPEDDFWLALQTHLPGDPMDWQKCRWISILIDGGGAVTVPEQMLTHIDAFNLDNSNTGFYFRDWNGVKS